MQCIPVSPFLGASSRPAIDQPSLPSEELSPALSPSSLSDPQSHHFLNPLYATGIVYHHLHNYSSDAANSAYIFALFV